MRTLVVLACLLTVALATNEWESFKAQFKRTYKNPTEEAFRKKIFLNNKMAIDQQNQLFAEGKSTFTMGVNQFADMTIQEFSETMNKYVMKERDSAHAQYLPEGQVNAATEDWRDSGCVTGVKDQGQCGSTWAFSATGSVEFVNCKASGKLVSLSEQNLVDCSWSYGNMGCDGGFMDNAFQYIIDNNGIDTEAGYPYTAQSPPNSCQNSLRYKGGSLRDYKYVTPSGSESALEYAVSRFGPVSAAIDSSHASFQLYRGGIYYEPLCSSTQLDQAVLVVGYGVEGGVAYWLVKNSWGVSWGINGYIQMSKDRGNQCGIATLASYSIH